MRPFQIALIAVAALVLLGQGSRSSAIEFSEIARFDVSFAFASDLDPEDDFFDDNPKYIGTNPLAIAWNGSKLYLGGTDNFGTSLLPIGLIEVINPTRTGVHTLDAGDFGDKFGDIFQPQGRGYTGLDLSGDRLAASYDNGSATANGIQLFDTATNTLVWDLNAAGITGRGGSGVSFDPGFNGGSGGQGVAWTTFGSGRRALQDAATGATIADLVSGFPYLPNPSPAGGNFPRDLDFNDATGDIYVRRNNDVLAATRTGDNDVTDQRVLVDNGGTAEFQLGQHVAFLSDTTSGDLIIYNDRPNNDPAAFLDVVKVVDTSGVQQQVNFNLLGGLTGADISDGVGIYDFDFDPDSNTLALLDFSNRNVFVFSVGDLPSLGGDYNEDGTVNAADYTVWRDNLGSSITLPGENPAATTPGLVDQEDYEFWRVQYGASASTAIQVEASNSAPEPASLLLLLIGTLSCRGRVRQA